MYTVLCDGAYLLHPNLKGYELLEPTVTLSVNSVGSFKFTIYPNHPMYSGIVRFKSLIEVYDEGNLIFRGRPLNDTVDINKAQTILCEGELAYLNDTQLPPYEFTGGISTYLGNMINNHNSQVEEYKHFQLGLVTVTDPNNTIVRANQEYTSTWKEITDKLISILGGYIVLRRENDINYIDYLEDALYTSQQEIELTKNMLDYQQEVNANDVITVMIPLGAKLLDEEGNETGQRLTIESVNGGLSYVENAGGIARSGRIWGVQIWDDVTDANNLKTKAISTLNSLVNLGVSITIKAVDLSLVDNAINRFKHFEYVRIKSKPHNIDDLMLIKKQTIRLDDPTQNTIELGVDYTSFTDKQLQSNNIVKKIYSNYATNDVVAEIKELTTVLQSSITQMPDEIRLWVSEQTYTKTLLDERFNEIYVGLEGIRLEVSQLGGYNIISNIIGRYGLLDWSFESQPFLAKSSVPYAVINSEHAIFAINENGQIMQPVTTDSPSGYGFKFWHAGKALSKAVAVEAGSNYSLYARVVGTGSLTFKLREYTTATPSLTTTPSRETTLGTSTPHTSYVTVQNTVEILTTTQTVRLVIESNVDIYNQQYAIYTDASFNIGNPKPYGESLTDVNNRVDSLNARVTVAEGQVNLFTSRVQSLEGQVETATGELNVQAGLIDAKVSKDGVIGSINLSPEGFKISSGRLEFDNAVGNNVNLTGNIKANTGKIAGFDISGNNLVGTDVSLKPSEITVGNATLKGGFVSGTPSLQIDITRLSISDSSKTAWLNMSGKPFYRNLTGGMTTVYADQLIPNDDAYGIGTSSNRYPSIYLQNQPNVSSDAKFKFDIEDIDTELLEMVSDIKPKVYRSKFNDQLHFGYIAQDVERILYAYCLKKYGETEANEWSKQFAVLSNDEEYLSLLYGELQVLTDAYTRMRISKLEMAVQKLLERK